MIIRVIRGMFRDAFRFFLSMVIVIVSIISLVFMVFGGNDDESTSTENNSMNEVSTSEQSHKNTKDGVLTKEKSEEIKQGMTYEQVVDIVGSEGTVLSESGTPGDQFHTVIYEFETDGSLSTANMIFQGGKLINKSQAGLESSEIEISLDQFNQLKNGMTKEEVFKILGDEGEVISESNGIVMYSYNGKSLGSSATFTFQDGNLISKSQIGLK